MTRRAWRQALLALCLLALAAPPTGLSRPAAGNLQITYVGSSSLSLSVNGSPVPAGGTVPAGSYNVLVDDADDTNPRFQLNGPGVSIDSNLNSTGMGIDRPATFGPFTFQAGSTYTARDVNAGISISFGVGAASSSSSSSSASSSSSSSSTSVSSSSSSSASSSSSSSAKKALVGTLVGSVSAAGKASLTFRGRRVTKLKAGTYALTVSDRSKKAGLVVEKLGYPAMTMSGPATVGSRSSRLVLSPGKWFFQASPGGAKAYFTVTS
jgi:hypothetical protein